ncbi:MAG: LPS-assembly protein LptD, partial [Negativicutes bacterium]|nr:LPS-assembly protein LptD [Negativicutes bacterium]
MPNTKMLLLSSLIMAAMVCTTLPGQAATSDAGQTKKTAEKSPVVVEKAPIVVEGDELYFNDSNGDLFANGNVVVTQGQAKVLGEMLRGNAKQNEIWIDDSSTFTEPGTRLVGTTTRYNYGTKTGTMQQASGKVEHEIVTGEQIDFMPDKIIIHNGTQTGCPAKVPDYHLSADRIEIWPGDKLIAYNAK